MKEIINKKLETLKKQDLLNIDSIEVHIFVLVTKHDNQFARKSEVGMKNEIFMISVKYSLTSKMSADKLGKL